MNATIRQRIFSTLALLASGLLHLAIILWVMDLTIGAAESSLFTSRRPPAPPVEVYRSSRDRIIEGDSDAANPADRADELDPTQLAPAKLAPPPPPADTQLAEPADAPTDLPTDAAPPDLAEAAAGAPLDVSNELLTLAQPSLSLPTFNAADDAVTAPPPSDIDAALTASLNGRVLRPGGTPGRPGGGGAGGGVAGGTGTPTDTTLPALPPLTQAPPPRIAPPAVTPDLLGDLPDLASTIAPPPQIARVAEHLDDDFDYTLFKLAEMPRREGLLEFIGLGDKPDPNEPGWFEVRISPRRSLSRLRALHKDTVWVVDMSGSISSAWTAQVLQGVSSALDALNEGDRFNIVAFRDTVSVLSPRGPLDATAHNIEAARRFLGESERGGWTDVNSALSRLLVRSMPDDRVFQIVLISDGRPTRGAIDPRQIINMITRENDLIASIYCVAVGAPVDRELLQYLAYRNKGRVVYPEGVGQAAGAIRDLAGRLRYPIMKDATFTAIGVDAERIFPRISQDLYQGQTVALFGRYRRDADEALSMRLTGTSGGDLLDLTFRLDFDAAEPGEPRIATDWAVWNLHHLYSEVIRTGETRELRSAIDALRKKYDIKTRY